MAHLLIVEDDPLIRDRVVRALVQHGHVVDAVETGAAALPAVVEEQPDVVILDLGLPDLDGRKVLSMIRATSQVPVIVATARDDEAEIVRTLDAGADDYVVKPFSAAQLDARVRAVLRRAATGDEADELVQVGGLRIRPRARVAILDGEELDLSRLEFDLLLTLARRPDEVISRRELFVEVWRQPYGGADRTVDVHLSWLRRKLGETAADPVYLHTVRGVGVKLVDPSASPGVP